MPVKFPSWPVQLLDNRTMAPSVTYSLGPWVLGISGDLLLQGALFTQFAHYLALYREDVPALRVFVGGLMLLTTLKSVQGIVILWKLNVDLFSNVQAALQFTSSSPFMKLNLVWVALIAFYVQLFFCYRLWVNIFCASELDLTA
ncbi:hypothetical protein B0H14DRAFT_3514879 [Mycena olivaceomarginata]|nr:hypothetical protein B0H14DRAFT_3514879 [Mycena olivaceomarginata]